MPEAERHQLLVEWNDTTADYPEERCVHQLFEAQVERTPEAVAVVFEDERLTYRELNRPCQSAGAPLAKLGCEAGGAGGYLHGALARDGDRAC